MDIGTAKPSEAERRAVLHHAIDVIDPHETFSAGRYGETARAIVLDVLERGRVPLVVGGSGLYIRALVDGLFRGDFRDAELRERLQRDADEGGLDGLYRRLWESDPDAAQAIHVNDRKRIVRALEVVLASGIPISRLRREHQTPAEFDPVFFGLEWPRDMLSARIDRRVERMVENGLIDEVRNLLNLGYSLRDNALDSVGYKEVILHLEGQMEWKDTVALIKRNTRRFAKRQMTWFRRDKRIQWITVQGEDDLEKAADRITEEISNWYCF
jgi:tRNA dimethylallyltransferase